MKNELRKRTPFMAWLASLPLALFLTLVCWVIVGGTTPRVAPVLIYALPIHLLAYAVTGLPLFLARYRTPASCIWKLPISLITGGSIGIIMLYLTLKLIGFSGSALNDSRIYLVGGGYGLLTAIAAYFQRPTCD